MSHIQLNYAFVLFWSILGEIHRKIFFLVQKVTLSDRSAEILRKFDYLNKFEKGKIQVKICILLTNVFDQTSKMGQILTKTLFLLKVSHIQLNYAFLLFWSIFGEIHWNCCILVKKVTISERSSEILRNFFSQQVWKGTSPDKNFNQKSD